MKALASTLANFDTLQPGIDALHVRFLPGNFTVPNFETSKLSITRPKLKAGEEEDAGVHLFTDKTGPRFGKNAYHNGEHYHVDINRHGLSLHFNPSKIVKPESGYYLPTSVYEVHRAAQIAVERLHRDTGILLPKVEGGLVTRFDIAKQAVMPRNVAEYSSAFDMLKLKYARGGVGSFKKQTFTYGSGSSDMQVQFYDKLTELIQKETKKHTLGSPYMRSELRLLGSGGVGKYAGIKNVEELLNGGERMWAEVYHNVLSTKLFDKHKEGQLSLPFDTVQVHEAIQYELRERMKRTKGKGKQTHRGLISFVLGAFGVGEVYAMGIDNFLSLFPDLSAKQIYNHKRRFHEEAKFAERMGKPITPFSLLKEIRHKLLTEAA
jgi:hypothetical protein